VGGWLRTVGRLGKAYIWFYAALSVFAIVMMIYDYLTDMTHGPPPRTRR
jgi:hypothetical protein